jgi:hypothetical protein
MGGFWQTGVRGPAVAGIAFADLGCTADYTAGIGSD